MNNWHIVLENCLGERSIYLTNVTRGFAIDIILQKFVSGELSGKRYKQKNLMMWHYLDRDKLYLVNDKGLNKLGLTTDGQLA